VELIGIGCQITASISALYTTPFNDFKKGIKKSMPLKIEHKLLS
jgi:hypothetical protein